MLTHDSISIVVISSQLIARHLATWTVNLVVVNIMQYKNSIISHPILSFQWFLGCFSPSRVEEQFHGLKICERWPHCKSQKQQQFAQNLFYFLSNHILAYNYQVYHYVFSPTKKETFIFCMLWLCGHIELTTLQLSLITLYCASQQVFRGC
jgi:hypothetical protein